MSASVSLQVLRRLMPSTGASALALRHASPSLLFCSVSLRPCTFAVYLSHLCRAKADRRFGVGGPSPKPLHLKTIASMSSRDRIVPRRVSAASHSARRWLPQYQPLEALDALRGTRRLDYPTRETQPQAPPFGRASARGRPEDLWIQQKSKACWRS